NKAFSIADAKEKPVFLLLDLFGQDGIVDRNWYYFDFVTAQGCLFERPRTTLAARLDEVNGHILAVVKNTGNAPAISVEVSLGEASNTYYAEDCGLWLEPGEERAVPIHRVDAMDGSNVNLDVILFSAWNAEPIVVHVSQTRTPIRVDYRNRERG
ncbi:MAG: hypothetical protein WCL39_15205, partial [Armatimonadota bacterium]